MGKETKYFKDIIHKGKDTTIFAVRRNADLKTLLEILKEKPLTRKELTAKTYWSRGQIAGLLYRAQKRGIIKLKNRKISLVQKNL